jgi:hypothetical protein
MTAEMPLILAEDRIAHRIKELLQARKSPDGRDLTELLKAAQADLVRKQVAPHESRVDDFLKQFEGSAEEVLSDMRVTFVAMLRTAVVFDGERAFDSPRSRAVVHYSGQAVVYASFGKHVRLIKIGVCAHGIHWGGLVKVDQHYWAVDPSSSAESDFRRACEATAGTVSELLCDYENFRQAASIEEFLTAQAFADIIAQKTDGSPQNVWSQVLEATAEILNENAEIVREIMSLFDHDDVVPKKRLTPILARVNSRSMHRFLSGKPATA